MAKRTVSFVVTGKDGVQAFWIAAGATDIPLVDGKGSARLDEGDQMLVWWFAGEPGGKLAIVGKSGGETVVEVKKSEIPADTHEAAGRRPFTV